METNIKYAGFWVRLIADLIDSLMLDFLACVIALIPVGAFYWVGTFVSLGRASGGAEIPFFNSIDSSWLQFVLVFIRGVLSLGYFSWGHYRYGTTLGKSLLRIYVVPAASDSSLSLKQSLVRTLSYLVSYAPLGAGFLMAAVHPKKRALHDLIAGTVSVIRPRTSSVMSG